MPKYFDYYTDTLNKLQSKINYGKDTKNKWDFRLVLKVFGEFDDDVTSAGKLFHVCLAATGNVRYIA